MEADFCIVPAVLLGSAAGGEPGSAAPLLLAGVAVEDRGFRKSLPKAS